MADIAQPDVDFKAALREIPQEITGTARLVALAQKYGITDTKELAELCSVSRRMVQIAAKSISPSSETHCAEAKPISPKTKQISPNEMDCAPRAPARAHFDTNLSCEVGKEDTPLPSVGPQGGKTPKAKNGTRLPADWQLPDDWRQWARMNFASVTPEAIQDQADRFADYWHAKAGRGSTMLDWQATWRNWCRKAFAGPMRNGQPMNWGRHAYDQQPKPLGPMAQLLARRRAEAEAMQ